MSYLGRQPLVGNYQVLDAIVATTTDTYALTKDAVAVFPQTSSNCIVSLNGVIQAPVSSYTISGSNIVFASALTGSDSIDFITVLGDVLSIGTPTDGTVTTAKLVDSSVTTAKLNDGSVSLAKLTATGTQDATTFLRGDNTFQTIGVNTPFFQARKTTTQSVAQNVTTVVLFDSEDFDDDGVYDPATGKFEPSEAAYYYIFSQIAFATSGGNEQIQIYKNGTTVLQWSQFDGGSTENHKAQQVQNIVYLNGTTDYVQIRGTNSKSGGADLSTSLLGTGDACVFLAYKLIE